MWRAGGTWGVVMLAAASLAGCMSSGHDEGASASSAESSPAATPAGPTNDGGASTTDGGAPASDGGGPRGPSATTYATQLRAIGLDVRNLPSLDDLDEGKKMKVMVTFTKSMGVSCDGCHDPSDYSAATPQKAAATFAWETISRGMTMADGSPLYCDSCHYGRFHFLDRSDRGALMDWMQTNFVETLKRKDGQAMSCASCHNPVPTVDGD